MLLLNFRAALLFISGWGQGLPLLIAGTFTVMLKQIPRMWSFSHYLTLAGGIIVVTLGLYFLVPARWP